MNHGHHKPWSILTFQSSRSIQIASFFLASSTSDDLQMISIHGDRLDFSTVLHTRFQLSNQNSSLRKGISPSTISALPSPPLPPPLPFPFSLGCPISLSFLFSSPIVQVNPVRLLGTSVTHQKDLVLLVQPCPVHAQCPVNFIHSSSSLHPSFSPYGQGRTRLVGTSDPVQWKCYATYAAYAAGGSLSSP